MQVYALISANFAGRLYTKRGQSIFEVAYANLKYFFLQEGYKFYIDKKTVMPSFWQNRPTNNKGLEIPLIWPFFA
jgi:hypothetical protein